jgi:RNA polymerase sigma factor (sigma-70 family)
MTSDGELLRRYADTGSEDAFTELVGRHLDLVYSAALRQVNGDAHLAHDVAQSVFTDLARKAAPLARRPTLTGWLYTSTHFAAAKAVRTERRRQAREQEAHTMQALLHDPEPDVDWDKLRSVLDEAMHRLSEDDREAILLRFFGKRPLAEVGAELGVGENAARMRVERALEKLRVQLVRRGVTTPAAVLATTIATHAVQAAPAGLAVVLVPASIAGATAGAGTVLTFFKFMTLTKLQLGVSALIVAGAATTLWIQHRGQTALREENRSLRAQLTHVQTDNGNLSNRLNRVKTALTLSLPAPRVQVSTQPSEPATDPGSTNLIARMNRGEKAPTLTPEQAESFLNENHRTAASLLAAFRATGDRKLLEEAMTKFPNDPQVAFTAAYAPGTSSEDRRRWLDAFKQSAPENALASFLSALEHFKAKDTDQAIQDLTAAAGKQQFQDYSWDFIQNGEEAYRTAGYPEVEARVIPTMALVLPHLGELKQLNFDMIDLATAYRQAGDATSAQTALEMDAALGQRLGGSGSPAALITQLVGIAIESIALKQMDPNSAYGDSGQTVKDRLVELTQRRTSLTGFANQLDAIYSTISASDWISYHDRFQRFGEESAVKWILDKYGQK